MGLFSCSPNQTKSVVSTMSNTTTTKDEEEKKKRRKKMYLRLDDGDFVIDEEYITESKGLRIFYRCRYHGAIPAPIEGKSSRIIRMALEFSKKRGEIKNQHKADDEKLLLQDKLKDFDTNFLQHNHTDAFDLADVACRLQIKSLFYLTRKAAAGMLAQKTPDHIRNILDIHYDENKTSVDDFEYMKGVVADAAWAFKHN